MTRLPVSRGNTPGGVGVLPRLRRRRLRLDPAPAVWPPFPVPPLPSATAGYPVLRSGPVLRPRRPHRRGVMGSALAGRISRLGRLRSGRRLLLARPDLHRRHGHAFALAEFSRAATAYTLHGHPYPADLFSRLSPFELLLADLELHLIGRQIVEHDWSGRWRLADLEHHLSTVRVGRLGEGRRNPVVWERELPPARPAYPSRKVRKNIAPAGIVSAGTEMGDGNADG